MLSYWEQQSFLQYDHIVIGSGIVGLSTAINLAEKFPTRSILVLERGLLPSGASTRNAGFACMGSVTELLDDLTHLSEAEVVALYEKRKRGLEILRQRLGDDNIDYKTNGSYELISEKEADALDKLDYLNNLLKGVTGKPAFLLANDKVKTFGFSSAHTKALIENTCEGELDTGKMMRVLVRLALSKGIEIKTGAMVTHFEDEKNQVIVCVKDALKNEIRFAAKKLFICTNAFTKALLPDEDILPGRGQVLITKPIENLLWKGVYHFDKGYYYFREVEGRVLFGGGRNIDFERETTTVLELNQRIQDDLEEKLHTIILPHTSFEIDQRWSGIMAFGKDKQPIVKGISDNVFGAFRLGGMGVALGSFVAKELVERVSSI